ncbi:hypothetical protein C7M84_006796 [Penaeus vannamei]|uniref:Reverse transcriptase domain-containing protein n=1 Tax=Penaeus vannamei TaxID=6689 RepID=A0A3R7N1F6_PENVA|nr:hypothetical protein C7M84_006796 [Penaeus vannamei]
MVRKKDNSLRLCVDYRNLNKVTVHDAFPIPRIDESVEALSGAKYFSTFDLAAGYHQIEVHPRDRHKTAFSTPFGHFEFNRMPMGLSNSQVSLLTPPQLRCHLRHDLMRMLTLASALLVRSRLLLLGPRLAHVLEGALPRGRLQIEILLRGRRRHRPLARGRHSGRALCRGPDVLTKQGSSALEAGRILEPRVSSDARGGALGEARTRSPPPGHSPSH